MAPRRVPEQTGTVTHTCRKVLFPREQTLSAYTISLTCTFSRADGWMDNRFLALGGSSDSSVRSTWSDKTAQRGSSGSSGVDCSGKGASAR
jgi:hypothetical protein